MTAQYPGAIYTPRTMVNRSGVTYDPLRTKDIYAEDFNKDRAEIVAVETALGTNPEGDAEDVAERLSDIEASVIARPSMQDLVIDDTDKRHYVKIQITSLIASASTVDVFRFLNSLGNVIGTNAIVGTFRIYSVRSDTGGNAQSAIYDYVATGNGIYDYTLTKVREYNRGTSPISSFSIVADGVSGGSKLRVTTASMGAYTTKVIVSFSGLVF
jgi:hypothetical protein